MQQLAPVLVPLDIGQQKRQLDTVITQLPGTLFTTGMFVKRQINCRLVVAGGFAPPLVARV